ncbi:hypothetical protein BGZ46_008432 [Entomortierella lignicola]|nr:hypothetical protein BGZ46_008432 [Entomortierella lignicola]
MINNNHENNELCNNNKNNNNSSSSKQADGKEVLVLFQELEEAIQKLERIRQGLHEVSNNIFAPEYLRRQYKETCDSLDQSIARKRQQVDMWRRSSGSRSI